MRSGKSLSGYEQFALQFLFFGASAGFVYPSLLINSTKGAYWFPLAAWAVAALLSCWLYSCLLARLQGRELVGMLNDSLGKLGSGLLLAPVFLFIAGSLTVMLRAYSELITMTMLPTTPLLFLNGMIVAAGALAWAGALPIARAAKVLLLFGAIFSFSLLAAGISECKWSLGGPWLRTNGDFFGNKHFYAGSFIWMGFVFTALTGKYTPESSRRYRKSYTAAIAVGALWSASFIYLPVLTFGPELSRRLTFPYVSKMDSIYHYWIVFENMTAIFISVTMFYVLLVMAMKLHALGESVKSLFPAFKSSWIYVVLSVLFYAAASAIPSWRDLEHQAFNSIGLRMYTMFGFPALGLGSLLLKRKRLEKRSA